MQIYRKEIFEEIKSMISGKTIDALLPPVVFVIINSFLGLDIAIVISLGLAIVLTTIRLMRKQTWKYALGGLAGVTVASGLTYFTRNAANYFIGSLVSSTIYFFIAIISLFIGKPMAAWASHLSRGWPIEWYWRKDIKPAYLEVTWLWTFFILARLVIQFILWLRGNVITLAWAYVLLGWPVTFSVLVASYIYGIWRLNRLGGPGVEEYKKGKEPPWKGQARGF